MEPEQQGRKDARPAIVLVLLTTSVDPTGIGTSAVATLPVRPWAAARWASCQSGVWASPSDPTIAGRGRFDPDPAPLARA
jgi:hypothetical protein